MHVRSTLALATLALLAACQTAPPAAPAAAPVAVCTVAASNARSCQLASQRCIPSRQ